MLAVDHHCADVISTHSAISSVDLDHFLSQICRIAHLFLYSCISKVWGDSINSLSDSGIDDGDGGYMYEPTRSFSPPDVAYTTGFPHNSFTWLPL